MQNIFVKILSKKYHYVLFKTHVQMKNTKYEKKIKYSAKWNALDLLCKHIFPIQQYIEEEQVYISDANKHGLIGFCLNLKHYLAPHWSLTCIVRKSFICSQYIVRFTW